MDSVSLIAEIVEIVFKAHAIALVSFCLSVCAVILTVYQTLATRRHNRLSVRPRVDWTYDRKVGVPVRLTITNEGLGPAIVKSLTFHFQGVDYLVSESGLPEELFYKLASLGRVELSLPGPGSTLSVGTEMPLFTFVGSGESLVLHSRAIEALRQIGFTLVYTSSYNEVFRKVRPADGIDGLPRSRS